MLTLQHQNRAQTQNYILHSKDYLWTKHLIENICNLTPIYILQHRITS